MRPCYVYRVYAFWGFDLCIIGAYGTMCYIMIWASALNLVMNACCDRVLCNVCTLPYIIIITIILVQGINFGAKVNNRL